jgi:hypothetical protein
MSKRLVLSALANLMDFRLLMARHPDLARDHRRRSQAARARQQIVQNNKKNGEQHA